MVRKLIAVAAWAITASAAQAYTLKQRSYRSPDGSVAFACVTAPFKGTITFIPSQRFPSEIAAIIVPASNYRAFLHQLYPTAWYAAATADYLNGGAYTPAVRQFEKAVRRVPEVMFMAEGDRYGNYEQPHQPIDRETLVDSYEQIAAAISNCDLRNANGR